MSNGVLDIYEKLMLQKRLNDLKEDLVRLNGKMAFVEWKKSNDPSYIGNIYDESLIYHIESNEALIEQLEKRLQELTGEADG